MTSVMPIKRVRVKKDTYEYDKKAEEVATKVVSSIVLEDPFYGYLLLRMDIIQDPYQPTACTNGKYIKYNPTFLRNLTLSKAKGLFKHEVMHVAHMHHLRRDNREPRRWGEACDWVINAELVNAKVDLPDNGLIDLKYLNHSAEQVYNMLPPRPKGPGGGCEGEEGETREPWDWGGIEDPPGIEDESTLRQMEEDVRQDVINAINTAKIMGKEPVGIDRLIEELRQAKKPWKALLHKFFRSKAKDDASWKRPNKRWLPSDIILPSLYSEALGPLVIVIDTSGSMGMPELEIGMGVVNGVLQQTKPESIHTIYCDADVHNVQVFKPSDLPLRVNDFEPKGGGGTDFRPAFDYVKENKLKPCVMLFFTDMYGTFPDQPPNYPVIWCSTTKEKAPFGKTLEMS